MKRGRYTEQQIAYALRQAEGGGRVAEICRKLRVSEQTFYAWRKNTGFSQPEEMAAKTEVALSLDVAGNRKKSAG